MSVHKNKRTGSFDVRYRDETGKNRSKSFKTEREAKRFDRDIEDKKDKGERVNADLSQMLLSEFWETVYLPTVQLSNGTKTLRKRVWGTTKPDGDNIAHLRRKWAGKTLAEVNNRQAVLAWHDEIVAAFPDSHEPKVFKAHSLLVSIITHAVNLEYLHKSKISGLQPYYEPKDTGEPWLPVDIEAVVADLRWRADNPPKGYGGVKRAITRWRRRRDAIAVLIMAYAALRIGECFALQWPMLLERQNDGTYRLRKFVEIRARVPVPGDPEDRTKTSRTKRTPRSMRKPRIVELPDALVNDLREWWIENGRPENGYVLPGEPGGARLNREDLANFGRDSWHRSVRNVGLEKRPPKHLRMSCVSMWIRERRDEGTVADMAGHSTQTMWNTYRKAFLARMNATEPFDMATAIAAARSNRSNADVRPDVRPLRQTGTEG